MSVKPIDLQTNISQITEVGKNEQVRNEALIQQQNALAGESDEKSRLVKSRMEESKKGEGAAIRDQEEEEKGRRGKKRRGPVRKDGQETAGKKPSRDERLGRIIDVFK